MHKSSDRFGEVFFALCKGVDTPIALGAWLRFKHREHRQLAEMSVVPSDYLKSDAFAVDYLVTSYASKYAGLDTGIDTKAVALAGFRSNEERCAATNKRLVKARESANTDLCPEHINDVFFRAQRKIANLLGPFSWQRVVRGRGWGPGATLDLPRRRAHVDAKICELPITVTRRALPHLRGEIESDLHWLSSLLGIDVTDLGPCSLLPSCFLIREASGITTVAKNAKTDRVIAVEPRGNGFLQKGIGAFIRRRLKKVGVDLDDQTNNQEGARQALSLGLATLDLKAASDTVSKELVFELLPVDWALALDDLRTHYAELPDGIRRLEKFSSMGNGFTFELESLLFYALIAAVEESLETGYNPLVYGDDIICTKASAAKAIEVLTYAGFELNGSKSYVQGDFYESCGRHYFGNDDVTPVYQKEAITNYFALIRAGNRLLRVAYRLGHSLIFDPRIESAYSLIRRDCRHFKPFGVQGDDALDVPREAYRGRVDQNGRTRLRVIARKSYRLPAYETALYGWWLRLASRQVDRDTLVGIPERVEVTPYHDITIDRPETAYTETYRYVYL